MKKLMIITDSNSGITQSEAKELGIHVLSMPFTINDDEFFEEITISQDRFYELLEMGAEVTTSQPSEYMLEELWNNYLKDYEEVLYIPMTSGLSKTCENAKTYAQKYNGRVVVVDNKRISCNMKESVLEAVAMNSQGKSANEIKEYLESTRDKMSVYIMVPELKYLKRGGRISPAAAAIGSMLNIKPILSSRGEKFEKYAMVLSLAQAKKKMIQKVKTEMETEFKEEYEAGKMTISVAHTQNEKEALKFKEEIIAAFPKAKFRFVDPLSLSVSCHIGPGALAITPSINNYLD